MKVTNIHFHKSRKFGFSKKHGWLEYLNSELGAACSGWLPVNTPAHLVKTIIAGRAFVGSANS